MEEFKGKPGPWRWEGKVLCNDAHIVGGDGWAFNDADKKLIAAAPELLDALQDMLSGWEYIRNNHGDLYGVGWDRAQNKATSAINKALGK